MGVASDDEARGESTNRAAVRDLLAGALLLVLGVVVGGSALDGRADGIDYAFDALGIAWIAWGALRLVRNARAR